MSPKLTQRIHTYLQSEDALSIINSKDFYFQKAQDTFNEFLKYKVTEEQKNFLIKNLKEYDELKQSLEDSEELIDFGKLLFGTISYCDSKAHKKNLLNQYPDKRVLALAFVRMNNWVEQLLSYKFGLHVPDGSIKNAINYLLSPEENFTMLSENHRAQISENLLKKIYNKASFKDDILFFYSDLTPALTNTRNLSHLLSRFCYQIESEWKLNVIGLISPDRTGWQEEAIKIVKGESYIALWNHKKPNGVNETLKQLRQCIDDHGYFRIFYTSNYKVHYVAEIVDFISTQTELDDVQWKNKFGNIEWYYDKLNEYTDDKKSASWVYLAKRIYKVEDGSLTDYKFYKGNSYPSVGGQSPIIYINCALELKNQKVMEDKVNLLKYKKQIILQGPPGTGKTKQAKEIAVELLNLRSVKDLEGNAQFKLIQFHPSYTYEDFVRGISAESDGANIEYKNVNRTLGLFAKEAFLNFLDSNKTISRLRKDLTFNERFNSFKTLIINSLAKGEYFNIPNTTAQIIDVDDTQFKYTFSTNPSYNYSVLFSDFFKLYELGEDFKTSSDITKLESHLSRKSVATYYFHLYKLIESQSETIEDIEVPPLKNYVLIIDEINRANLSSVLGELIYALEYRGEVVESMYAVDGSNGIILPPNLYVIGTMNTADRSVGHIDYAIRRRFAFVDVLPKDLTDEPNIKFDKVLFNDVAKLFIEDYSSGTDYSKVLKIQSSKHLSEEFKAKDVWLGHSYFIDKSTEGGNIQTRLEYEIKPILLEYVKDGVLKESAIEEIEQLKTTI